MKVIKRDGRAVDYDRQKIVIAIGKANNEVPKGDRASKQEIKEIVEYIEALGKKRMLVEDIQDIIEQKLMERNKYNLAKEYIVYRYTRALVRKQNTTDESILGMIRNENKELNIDNSHNTYLASAQRDYIAGEVSKDLTKRLLLPEKITKADAEGVLHFHAADYFIHPIFDSCLINIADMLDKGTVINRKFIETPETFESACIITTQILEAISGNQYGGQAIDLIHFGKYVKKSYNKLKKQLEEKYKGKIEKNIIEEMAQDRLKEDISNGIKIIRYQINAITSTKGKNPCINLLLHLDLNDKFIKENAMIIEEFLKQESMELKNENDTYELSKTLKLIYVLDDCNNLTGGKYDYLTKLAIKCSATKMNPSFVSAKKMRENYDGNIYCPMGQGSFLPLLKDENGNFKFEGRFNQGVVSINLPQIGIIADGDELRFWKELDDRLELCKEALMCRHYSLLGTNSDISPIHWQYGAVARLKKGEKIDKLLLKGYSTLLLGYVGIYETTKLIKGVSPTTSEGNDFAIKLIKKLKNATKKWKDETGIGFEICGTPTENVCYKFARIDKEKFGTIPNITDKGHYTNSYHIDESESIDKYEKIKLESKFQNLSIGGAISYIDITNIENNISELEELVKFIYENIQYIEFKNKNLLY